MDLDDILADMGDRIRAERTARNWSRPQLSERAGISSPAIKRLEKHGHCTMATYVLACAALDISVSAVLSENWTLPEQIPTLAPRQLDVLEALAKGGSLSKAANRLNMPVRGVSSVVSRIYEKLGVQHLREQNRREAAIAIARKYDLISKETHGQSD